MTAFTRTWNAGYEAVPATSDSASEGAQRIREFKVDVKERLIVDHSLVGDVNDGFHIQVTFVDPLSSKPSQANDETYLYTKDVSGKAELFFEDEDGDEIQLTTGGVIVSSFAAGTKMIFFTGSAPSGWTIDTAFDNHIIIGEGTGSQGGNRSGTTNATSVFGSGKNTGSHAITVSQMPAHNHDGGTVAARSGASTQGSAGSVMLSNGIAGDAATIAVTEVNQGGSNTHLHTLSLDVKYAKGNIYTKN